MKSTQHVLEIRTTIAAWIHNRTLYPGWLIAPRESRQRIWLFSASWIQRIVDNLEHVDYDEQLQWCFELNWRLEVALVPILAPLSDSFRELIMADHPFAIDGGEHRLNDNGVPINSDNLVTRRVQWLSLAFAVLRHFREAALAEEFEKLAARLETIVNTNANLTYRLAYERCLSALGRLDHQGVRKIVERIEFVEAGDPYWLVRFAALLCELGELDAAERKAYEGLLIIRSRIDPSGQDLAMPSREGWAMLLASGLEEEHLLRSRTSEPRRQITDLGPLEGRWGQLEFLKCNPWPELEDLRLRLRHLPDPQPDEELSIGFDNRVTQRILRFTRDILPEGVLTSLQGSRLIEEVAYPPMCGRMVMSRDLLQAIIRGLGGHALSVVLPLMLRSEETGESKRFSKTEVAALEPDVRHRLFALLHTAIRQFLPELGNGVGRDSGRATEFGQLATAVELLSRLTVCVSTDEVAQSLTLGIVILRPSPRRNIRIELAAVQLLSRAIEAAPSNLISERVFEIMNLPLWPAGGATVTWSNVPSPGQLLARRRFSLSEWVGKEQWRNLVSGLLRTAEQGHGLDRSDALLRLSVISDSGGLTEEQSAAFGRTYWQHNGGQWRLPAYLNATSMLAVPEPEPGLGERMFKRWCLERPLPRFREAMASDQPGARAPIVVNIDRESPLKDLAEVSGDPAPLGHFPVVRWNAAEASTIFANIWAWWKVEGDDAAELLGSAQIRDQVYIRLYNILRVIVYIVIPHRDEIPDFSDRFAKLISTLEQLRFPVVFVLPLSAAAIGLHEAEVEARFREALVSTDEQLVNAALDGLHEWSKWELERELPPVPFDLLAEMAGIVAARRRLGLLFALRVAASIARRRPELITGRIATALRSGLDYLFTETQYRPYSHTALQQTISYPEIPRFRQAAVELVVALRVVPELRGDPTILRWLAAARDDPLPEIRRVVEEAA